MEYLEHKAIWFPSATRVAGVRIWPPTLGQIRLLESVGSPFLVGGQADADDCLIARHLLATPWRLARRRVARPLQLACRLRLESWLKPLDAAAGREIEAFIGRALWLPERYERDGAGGSAGEAATGVAVRLGLRAARLGLGAVGHGRRGAWDCVWDIPVDAILAYGTAAAEIEGNEYQTREETESPFEQQLQAHADAGDDQPRIDQHPQDVQHVLHGGNSVADADGPVNSTREAHHG